MSESQSQWALMRIRFSSHRPAIWSLWVLCILYLIAAFAEFIAPYPALWHDLKQINQPPQPVLLSLKDGLYAEKIAIERHPITFRSHAITEKDVRIPLGFFVKGEPYHHWGSIPLQRHLFGVNLVKWMERYPEQSETPRFYLLGSDQFGRDLFSRLCYGARISLSIGLVAIVVTMLLGLSIGGLSGYRGGRIDNLIQRMIEIIQSIPQLPLWIALSAVVPNHWSPVGIYFGITVVLALLSWTGLARVVRGKVLSLRDADYVVAARLLGASSSRIVTQHLLPSVTSHVIVVITLTIPAMILGETSLSFLGLGLRPPAVSWGLMLQDCTDDQSLMHYPWVLAPVFFIVLTVLAFNFIGDGLRDAADPYSGR